MKGAEESLLENNFAGEGVLDVTVSIDITVPVCVSFLLCYPCEEFIVIISG